MYCKVKSIRVCNFLLYRDCLLFRVSVRGFTVIDVVSLYNILLICEYNIYVLCFIRTSLHVYTKKFGLALALQNDIIMTSKL